MSKKLLFVDYCGLVSNSHKDIQEAMDLFFPQQCIHFSLELIISLKKRKALYQPTQVKIYTPPEITIRDQLGDIFTFLGSTLSHESNIDDEITNQMGKASVALDRLH